MARAKFLEDLKRSPHRIFLTEYIWYRKEHSDDPGFWHWCPSSGSGMFKIRPGETRCPRCGREYSEAIQLMVKLYWGTR